MISVVGYGYVGKAVVANLKNNYNNDNVKIFDADDEKYIRLQDMSFSDKRNININAELIILCLPTPPDENGKVNSRYITDALDFLNTINYSNQILIKSTILYKYIQPYINELNIVYSPEFLNQRDAIQDMYKEKTIVLGGDAKNCAKVREILTAKLINGSTKEYVITDMEDAINLKYARNIKNALNVLYWNMIEDVFESDVENISKLMEYFPTQELSNITQDGSRGYGGACLPKDVNAVKYETGHTLLKAMTKYNTNLITRD